MVNPLLFNDPGAANDALFGAYGFNPQGSNEMAAMFQKYAMYLYPEVARELGFMTEMGGNQRNLIRDFVSQMGNPDNLEAERSAFQSGAYENAGKASAMLGQQLAGQGFGSGAIQGATEGQYGQAARGVNSYSANQASPEARLQRIMASIQAIEGGTQNKGLGAMLSMFGPKQQAAEFNHASKQNNWLGQVLGAAGTAAGMGAFGNLGGLFGGGGGGATQAWDNPFDGGNGAGVPF